MARLIVVELLVRDLERLDDVHERVERAGVVVLERPRDQPWGRSAAHEDPDGNAVSVTERPA